MSWFGSVRIKVFRTSTSSISSLSSSSRSGSEDGKEVDAYCLRQSARTSEEYDLEQKIDLEIKMQEGTTKLLAACKYQLQALEAAKSLLTSSERMNAYVYELQRRKTQKQKNTNLIFKNNNIYRFNQIQIMPCKGKVAITDIRMPLIWKDSDHFKNRGDCRRFAVFCLLKIGADVQDTAMINNVDRSLTDIAFDDVIIFNHVPHDYEFRLEVYSYVLHEDLSIASASNKLKKKISYSVSKAIGKKLVANMKDDVTYKGGVPGLELVAHASLSLEDANPRIKTYDLTIANGEKSRQQLPLFGHFCCRMAVQPECMVEEVYSGYLSLVQKIGNLTGSRRMWSSLKNFSLSMWTNAGEIHSSKPDIAIPVKKSTKVFSDENANSYPRYSFKIENSIHGETTELQLAADTSTELSAWVDHIHQHIQDYDLWKPASDSVVEIPSPTLKRHSQFTKNRISSLYDDTPFTEDMRHVLRYEKQNKALLNKKPALEGIEPSSPVFGNPYYEAHRSNRLSTPPLWSSSSSSTSNSGEVQTRPKTMYNRRSMNLHFPF